MIDELAWPLLVLGGITAGPLVQGVVLGIGAAVPPGPVNLEIARRTARGGFWSGATVGLGAVTIDVLLALLLVAGVLRLIHATAWIRIPVNVLGVLLLLWLGIGALGSFQKHQRSSREIFATEAAPKVARPSPLAGYSTGLLLCGTSPYQALFWLVAVPGILPKSAQDGGTLISMSAALLCVGVFITTLTWVACFAGAMSFITGFRRAHWLAPTMDLIGGCVLLGFAGLSAWKLTSDVLWPVGAI